MLYRVIPLIAVLTLSACTGWIYRIDIPQGNFLEQKDIDKLQIGMTKEQVKFVLGTPVVTDAFNDDVWHYVYRFKSGRDEAFNKEKVFVVSFQENKLTKAEGDFELPESFYNPIVND
ncbi:outer membrane protein assembly factor BamE [Thalassotalea marina]|uniref:Outer membrane protein assembly factor BamE n=1 Tax=Thalassotalea marina TaxID=1673741 RepID=A0A919BCA4_9GAMM|nr:outer membrane protein assembly factor BamE [Thalassotalea marina]GHF81750.1 outer membrane protein assembly factor BamE [Thalassotalea marina]